MNWKKAIFIVILSMVALRAAKFVRFLGIHKNMYDHQPSPCFIKDYFTEGAEDIQVIKGGVAFVSSGLRLSEAKKEATEHRVGRINVLDFKNLRRPAYSLTLEGGIDEKTFQPHGIYAHENSAKDTVHLYVVNHKPDGDTVEKFLYDRERKALFLQKTFTHELFRNLNDLVVVGEDKFYFTNFYYSHMFAELVLGLRWGYVGFYNGKVPEETRVVVDKLFLPNGITKSHNERVIYVGTWGDQTVNVYDRTKSNRLLQKQVLPVYTSVDNLNMDFHKHELWVAGDYLPYMFISYLGDPENLKAPAQVLNMMLRPDGRIANMTEVYAEELSVASGSSVAVQYSGSFVIGSKMAGVLVCDILHIHRKKTIMTLG